VEIETFASKLKQALSEDFEHFEWMYDIDFINSIINTFEIYGDFLNDIPTKIQGEIIVDLIDWIYNYYVRQQTLAKYNKLNFYPKIDASKRIIQIEHKLEEFSRLIDEEFGEFLEEYGEYGENIHYPQSFIKKLRKINSTKKLIQHLHNDIHHKKFKWFNKKRFYSHKTASKQDLSRLLTNKNNKHTLGITQLNIKELVDNIQVFKLSSPI
jgi:hypothetical protein